VTRLPYLRYDDLGPDARRVWDAIASSRGDEAVTPEGGLAGPFNAFVHAPAAGRRLSALGQVLRFGTSIEPRLTEVAIITVGARWKAEFEWWAHAQLARRQGVSDDVVDAIGHGGEPPFTREDERVVYTVARELTGTGQLSQPAHDAAAALLGPAGLVELVSLCGYYTLISYLLNSFTVDIPAGATPMWDESAPGAER
jgi:4-carboxymuconolactone decarboxylase